MREVVQKAVPAPGGHGAPAEGKITAANDSLTTLSQRMLLTRRAIFELPQDAGIEDYAWAVVKTALESFSGGRPIVSAHAAADQIKALRDVSAEHQDVLYLIGHLNGALLEKPEGRLRKLSALADQYGVKSKDFREMIDGLLAQLQGYAFQQTLDPRPLELSLQGATPLVADCVMKNIAKFMHQSKYRMEQRSEPQHSKLKEARDNCAAILRSVIEDEVLEEQKALARSLLR